MSTENNLAMVRRMYAGVAPDVVAEVVADDFTFDITPGSPLGGVYHGWTDVAENYFGKLVPQYRDHGAVPESLQRR